MNREVLERFGTARKFYNSILSSEIGTLFITLNTTSYILLLCTPLVRSFVMLDDTVLKHIFIHLVTGMTSRSCYYCSTIR